MEKKESLENIDLHKSHCVHLESVVQAMCASYKDCLFHYGSPSVHFPGFTALERQTGGRCAGSLNRPKEVLTSSLLSSARLSENPEIVYN